MQYQAMDVEVCKECKQMNEFEEQPNRVVHKDKDQTMTVESCEECIKNFKT